MVSGIVSGPQSIPGLFLGNASPRLFPLLYPQRNGQRAF